MQSVVVGAVIAATLAAAIPVSAKVAVRDHEDVIIRDHEHGSTRHRGWYRDHAECRTMRVRTHLPDGKIVIKTRRSC
jgi:hypothetical protein